MSKKIQSMRLSLYRHILRRPKECFWPGCQEKCIGSHILQKNGILDRVSEDGKIYMYECSLHDQRISFKSRGVNERHLKKQLFCADHDSSVFSPIENTIPDWKSYNSKALQCYRGMLGELRLQLDYLAMAKEELRNQEIASYVGVKKLELDILKMEVAEELLNRFKILLENDLFFQTEANKNFCFFVRQLDNISVAASAFCGDPGSYHIGIKTDSKLTKKITEITGCACGFPPGIFFNLIPNQKGTLLICGYYKSDRISQEVLGIEKMGESELFDFLGKILLQNVEHWYCSPSFYKNYIFPRKVSIEDEVKRCALDKEEKVTISLFSKPLPIP